MDKIKNFIDFQGMFDYLIKEHKAEMQEWIGENEELIQESIDEDDKITEVFKNILYFAEKKCFLMELVIEECEITESKIIFCWGDEHQTAPETNDTSGSDVCICFDLSDEIFESYDYGGF